MVIKIQNKTADATIGKIIKKHEGILIEFKKIIKKGEIYLCLSGDLMNVDLVFIKSLDDVEIVMGPEKSFYFCGKSFAKKSSVEVGNVSVGIQDEMIIIAGPCAIENYKDLYETAIGVKKAGASIFRGGAFKPRTSPYNFQGIGSEGLKMLKKIHEDVKIPVVSEIMSIRDIELAEECLDMIQVGARNFTNVAFLKELGKCSTPILLKKGLNGTNTDLVKAAEFISYNGNDDIILCERGIQTGENLTRFTLDLSSVPVLREITHLPICIDPSHAAGRRELVPPLAKAATLLGADCLEIEVHVRPDETIKPGDGVQSLDIVTFESLVGEINKILGLNNRKLRMI